MVQESSDNGDCRFSLQLYHLDIMVVLVTHPTELQLYDDSSWYCNGDITPRGSKLKVIGL